MRRRDFLKTAAALPLLSLQRGIGGYTPDPWDATRAILARIKEPVFPNRDFNVTRCGSINEAIAACSAAGGGRVVVPAGEFMTGALRLKSRVNLHLLAGSVVKFSTDPKAY